MTTKPDYPHVAAGLWPLVRPVEGLKALERNPRKGDVEAVAASLRQFGQRKPIVARRLDDGFEVTAGNHTLAAAKVLGWAHLAVLVTDDDERTARAFALADNRSHDLGGYDEALLDAMLAEFAADVDGDEGGMEGLLEALKWVPEAAEPKAASSTRPAVSENLFTVVVECDGEAHQTEVLADLAGAGYRVRGVTRDRRPT